MKFDRCHAALWAAAFLLVTLQHAPARAENASAWSQDTKSAVRLIGGTSKSGAPLRAGIEIKLQPGWHTYWRYPGDAGVPPRFDFSGSDNVKLATVSFPAPHLFTDETGSSIGYKDGVIFPVTIVAKDPARPVNARLKIEYAVCEKMCIPAEGKAELAIAPGPGTEDTALTEAEARVPKKVSAADIGLTARRVNDAAKPLVAIDVIARDQGPMQIFVEGPGPEWALPIPKPAPGAPTGHRHFAFDLDGLPPGVSPKGSFDLTFTVVEGGRAMEVTTHLD
ncbi:protein-disulfide reductase DsbD domain-containing protein [Pseudolabrys sp. Root1462]|uniref:protein-disulfide reductase DsbD domain-containing protein n=1 Tax=Pseudolabrys sp. Root1462 TaxID=1736466 RepID=UPI0009E88C48|nr:protein-disulfide reductase DsbD domain-containing protein [Pseudolabrys sp. Root1462]